MDELKIVAAPSVTSLGYTARSFMPTLDDFYNNVASLQFNGKPAFIMSKTNSNSDLVVSECVNYHYNTDTDEARTAYDNDFYTEGHIYGVQLGNVQYGFGNYIYYKKDNEKISSIGNYTTYSINVFMTPDDFSNIKTAGKTARLNKSGDSAKLYTRTPSSVNMQTLTEFAYTTYQGDNVVFVNLMSKQMLFALVNVYEIDNPTKIKKCAIIVPPRTTNSYTSDGGIAFGYKSDTENTVYFFIENESEDTRSAYLTQDTSKPYGSGGLNPIYIGAYNKGFCESVIMHKFRIGKYYSDNIYYIDGAIDSIGDGILNINGQNYFRLGLSNIVLKMT